MIQKKFLFQSFEMKDLGDFSNILGIEIYRDKSKIILELSHNIYYEKLLKKFIINECTPNAAPILKGDKFSLSQCKKKML